MAYVKEYSFALDFRKENSISLPGIVSGDTGNVFYITFLDNGEQMDLSTFDSDHDRIRLIITNKDGQGAQDTAVPDPNWGSAGFTFYDWGIEVTVFSTMISNGLNTGKIEYYTEDGAYLVTSQDFTFIATNSPSEKAYEYPSLVKAEQEYDALCAQIEEYINEIDPDSMMRYPTPRKANYIVETDDNGDVTLIHRLFITNDPSSLTGLQEGDIILSPAGR